MAGGIEAHPRGASTPRLKEDTRKEYLQRVNRVIEYMNANPEKKLSLRELSAVANFSEYHFHRIFQAIAGETLSRYQNRIRLAHAAHRLLHRPELSVTDIAFGSGFSSLSDFERSFKNRYRTTPSRYRGGGGALPRVRTSLRLARCVDKNVRMETIRSLPVAYRTTRGLSKSFKNPAIVESYRKLWVWAMSRGLIDGSTLVLGLYPDNPESVPFAECRYLACISVPEGTRPDGEIGVMRLECGGRYLCHPFNPRNPLFPRRFFRVTSYLYGEWMPDHGYFPDDKPFLEIYRRSGEKVVSMDFLIPISQDLQTP